ncbi:MAG: hypothetical protein JO079_03235 [Frankiaceae bacterium]|nr:hypothetical protein [Frankiaceae bacterium]
MTAIAVVLPLALVVLLLWNVRRPANVRLDVRGDQLIVELRGWDTLYCVKRRIVVPVADVEGVGVYQRGQVPAEGLRMPGTGVPGVIRAGSYGTGTTRDFWDVRNGAEVLVVQLKPGNGYRRIVLEVPEPREEMLRLRPVLGALSWVPSATN